MKRSYCNSLLKARLAFSTLYDCFSTKDDSEPYFSRSGCEICPEGLAGEVQDVTYLAREDMDQKNFDNVYESEICGGCLCSLVNGDDTDLDYYCDDEDEAELSVDEASAENKADKAGVLNARELKFKDDFSNLMVQLMVYQNYDISVNGEREPRTANELYNRFFNNTDEDDTRQVTSWLNSGDYPKIMEFCAYDINLDFYFNNEPEDDTE